MSEGREKKNQIRFEAPCEKKEGRVEHLVRSLGGYTLSEASDPPLRTGRTPALAAQRV